MAMVELGLTGSNNSMLGAHFTTAEESIREQAHKLCRDYLHGAWLTIQPHQMTLKKVSGGLSNLLYYCALPEGVKPKSCEPSRLLLRLYGQVNGERAMETLITESVIFTLLSESQRGPRLYGVFPGGRLEEYVQARPLVTRELADPTLSVLIADKMAQIHLMDVPINKQPKWLWETMESWLSSIEQFTNSNGSPDKFQKMVNKLQEYNIYNEYKWLKEFLVQINSPVVFCHNDLQEGNILLRDQPNYFSHIEEDQSSSHSSKDSVQPTKLANSSIVIIDYEYCSYNYRGFDFANHFCEWIYDYTNENPPYFWEHHTNSPSDEQKEAFIKSYLNSLQAAPNYKSKPKDTVVSLMEEINAFQLASHFFWALWSVVNSTASSITFDYWGYGEARFKAYFRHKSSILKQ